jgi:hypothetical protein
VRDNTCSRSEGHPSAGSARYLVNGVTIIIIIVIVTELVFFVTFYNSHDISSFTKCIASERGWGHAVAYWLRHYATSRKVAGSRPDEMNFFFNLHNPSGDTTPWGLLSL